MRLSFDSIEEVKLFVASLKGTRGKKGEDDVTETGSAPTPILPPAGGSAQGFSPGGMSTAQFAPPVGGAAQAGGAFPVVGASLSTPPEIVALVSRIVTKLDSAIASGQPADQALAWFKSQCGPETANYTLDQIKQQALPKLSQPVLENMAKLMAA